MKIALVALLGVALAQAAVPSLASDQGATKAVWVRHEVDFVYMGFTTHYSCEGLRDKLAVLMKAAGARPDFKISMRGCPGEPGRVTEFPRVNLVFYTAGPPATGAQPAAGLIDARWKTVSISPLHPKELEIGDCELVEQFHDRLLREFTTRNADDDTNCIPHQLSGSTFSLHFDVLQGPPAAGGARR